MKSPLELEISIPNPTYQPKTYFRKYLAYTTDGLPCTLERQLIYGDQGWELRMNLVENEDGIILLGTMDLDPFPRIALADVGDSNP